MADENGEVEARAAPRGERRRPAGADEPVVVPLRKVDWMEERDRADNDPLSVPALGMAYRVLNVVDRVEPGSPAAKAGLQAGDVVTKAEFVFPKTAERQAPRRRTDRIQPATKTTSRPTGRRSSTSLQELPPGTKVKLTYKRGDESREADAHARRRRTATSSPERGLIFDWIAAHPHRRHVERGGRAAAGTKRSARWAWSTASWASSAGQVPVTSLGGPVTIAQAAGFSAVRRPGQAAGVPHDAQRQPGGDQLPADPAVGRRAHGVPAVGRHPRQAGRREVRRGDAHRRASCSSSR